MVLIDKLDDTPEEYRKVLNKIDKLPHNDNALIMLDNSTWEPKPVIRIYHNRDEYPSSTSVSIITDISRIFEDNYEIGTQYSKSGVTGFTDIPKEAPESLNLDNCSYTK